ncbi:MAG: sigma-70 family polymerase sigma factor [Frankiales bacterium]|nr:sigma-70 family polymerase sigma factor [Frankiales bacterium]
MTPEQRFEELAAEVLVPLQRFIRRRTDDGDDVLADTMLVLWRRLDDVPDEARLPWAYGVARGCLQNARRSEQRRWNLLRRLATEPAAPPPAPGDPDLADGLASLPETDREVLRLWAWEDLAPREIAVALGISANAASIRLHRATAKLRTALIDVAGPSVVRKEGKTPGQEQGRQGQEAPR